MLVYESYKAFNAENPSLDEDGTFLIVALIHSIYLQGKKISKGFILQ